MRLKAREHITYAGQTWPPGSVFDALERDGLDMINKDQAVPFNLEDPSQRSLPPLGTSVSISPVGVFVTRSGGTGRITVTITEPGLSGSWTVSKDPEATWLTYAPMTPQSTDGTATWTAQPNAGAARIANLYINGTAFKVDQNAGGLP